MNSRIRLDRLIRFSTITQVAIIMFSGVWLSLSLALDIPKFIHSPFLEQERIFIYAFSLPIVFFGTAPLILYLLWLYARWYEHQKLSEHDLTFQRFLRFEMSKSSSVLVSSLFLVVYIPSAAWFFLADAMFSLSVVPLTTSICGIVGICIGYGLLHRVKPKDRLTLLALSLSLILAVKYIDCGPKKSLMRDMYRIRQGMTVDEVERVMAKHKTGPGGAYNYSEEKIAQEDVLLYMTPYSADIVSVYIGEGKVQGVSFSLD